MRTILVIDDEKEMRHKFKKILKSAGFDVLEAPDALEVANILMRDKSRIDLILLDIQIPEVDGRDIFGIIDEYAPSLDIIVTSVFPVSEQKFRIPKAVDYFNKADGEKVLLNKVKTALGLMDINVKT